MFTPWLRNQKRASCEWLKCILLVQKESEGDKNAEKRKKEVEKINTLLSYTEEIKRQKIDLQITITQLEVNAIACYKKAEASNNETNRDEEVPNLKKEVKTSQKKSRK